LQKIYCPSVCRYRLVCWKAKVFFPIESGYEFLLCLLLLNHYFCSRHSWLAQGGLRTSGILGLKVISERKLGSLGVSQKRSILLPLVQEAAFAVFWDEPSPVRHFYIRH